MARLSAREEAGDSCGHQEEAETSGAPWWRSGYGAPWHEARYELTAKGRAYLSLEEDFEQLRAEADAREAALQVWAP